MAITFGLNDEASDGVDEGGQGKRWRNAFETLGPRYSLQQHARGQVACGLPSIFTLLGWIGSLLAQPETQHEAQMMTQSTRSSQVFIVRTWQEERGENHYELRGMVRDLHSGETRYFGTWEAFLTFIQSHLTATERSDSPPSDQPTIKLQ